MPRAGAGWRFATVLAVVCLTITLRAAEPEERTRQAYQAYAARIRQTFIQQGAGRTDAARVNRLRTGAIIAGAGGGDGIVDVPGGLIHHWAGAVFLPGATLDAALRLSQRYSDYPSIYESVVGARVLGRDGDTHRLLLRFREGGAGITAVLDVWSTVRYVRVDGRHVYSLSDTTEIREVAEAGRPGERLLPPGEDRGYLWRGSTFTRYIAYDDGVVVELETLGLSRGFPPMLGWVIEPIARRIGRKSAEGSLREFRDAMAAGRTRAPA